MTLSATLTAASF